MARALPDGTANEAWVVDYTDRGKKRRLKTFRRKRDADAYHAKVTTELAAGTHVADRASITVAEAGKLWLALCDRHGLERSSWDRNARHLRLHIEPFIGTLRLTQLTIQKIAEFEDALDAAGRSPALVRAVTISLSGILAEAQARGLVAQNVVRARPKRRRQSNRKRLEVGVDIPTPDEIRRLIPRLTGPRRPLILTAIFTGLRASELRGLRWADIDLKHGELRVRQRADQWNTIGTPKSKTSNGRAVPLPPSLVAILREHKIASPPSRLDLAFANTRGNVDGRPNIVLRTLQPAMIAAGLVNSNGKAKYTGLHALRHFYASWCINRKADGGLELPLKVVSERLGHASVTITADRYGHLFPRGDDGKELADAAKALLG